jgi:hypothetical protein
MAWGNEPRGTYSTGGIVPSLEGRANFHVGLFSDTLKPFLQSTEKDSFLAFANIDCDLYSSTLDILEAMHGRVVPGTILIFDEYMAHPSCKFSLRIFAVRVYLADGLSSLTGNPFSSIPNCRASRRIQSLARVL